MQKRPLPLFAVLWTLTLTAAVTAPAAGAESVLRATLENGLRVIIVKNTLAPVVTTQVNYLVGSNESPAGFPGMAHAQEHMLFRGSPGLSAEQLAGIIAGLGGRFNADTQQTVTQYYFTLAREHLDIALGVEAARMRGAQNAPDLWAQERGALLQEVAQDLSNPEYILYTRLLAELFAGTPYAHDALGTTSSFDMTTSAMLLEFYKHWYAPNNAILVITGDVDLPETLAAVKKHFGRLPRRPIPDRPNVNLQPLRPAAITLDTDRPYGMAVVAFRLPGYDSPDYAAGVVLADVLDSRRGNLYALVPEGRALSAGFDAGALPRSGFGIAQAAFPDGGDGPALVAAIKKIIAAYVKDGFPADLVQAAIRREIREAEFQKNSIAGLAAAWSQAVAVENRFSPDDDIDALKRVTVDDVNRVARICLLTDTAVTALVTPRMSGNPVSAKGYGGGESFAPKRVTTATLPAWARKADTLPNIPQSRVRPSVTILPNGLRLITQTEDTSATVTVIGRVKHEDHLQEPEGKEGVSSILARLMDYGTTSLDRLAFQKALDEISADVSVGPSFSLRVLSEHFNRGMELLADNLLHPALPESSFSIVREETVQALRGLVRSPSYLSGRTLRQGLFPANDPSLTDAMPETASRVQIEDVRDYHSLIFRPDMTTIVLIGKVTPKQARAVVKKYFGRWRASGARPQTDLPAVPPSKPSQAIVPDASRVQSEVILAQTIGITRRHPDYYPLMLGNHILSGSFYASRLYRDLREKTGLVYHVGSEIEAEKHRSVFSVVYGCDPSRVAKARGIVEQDLRDMQTTTATPAEIRRAKILLLRQIPLGEASIDGIAEGLISRAMQDLPLDEPRRAARQYLRINAGAVRGVFKKWIRPADFVEVTLGPAP